MKGKVCLVGAGPGDPGLLTLRALKAIRQADLIVYDYLTNPAHLTHAKKSARAIGVGKGFRHKRPSQERINRLILSYAKAGKNVVRLKGGDPYLFGRGGEEALHLVQNRVPFEVVPGVTSATAAAAYAGIPLTHRHHNASVTLLTGHRAHDNRLDTVRWKEIVAVGGTLVIYMGFYNLAVIARRLVDNGMRPNAPVAVIEWGTLPRQKSVAGTLKNIAAKVERGGFKPPCLIVVGDVVSLAKTLGWYEKLPLFGKKIVVTRQADKNILTKEKLEDQGAQVVEFPTIEIKAPADFGELDAAIAGLHRYDWVVFTSQNGVEYFFERLRGKFGLDTRWLGSVKVAAVGPHTARALIENGVRPDLEPTRFETLAIVEAFEKRFGRLNGKKILLPRTDIAPPELEKGLRRLEAEVQTVTAYRTALPAKIAADARKTLLRGQADYVTFTSASTVDHFVKILGLKNVKRMSRRTRWASIGPVTSAALRRHGLKPFCEAKRFTVDGLVKAIRDRSS